MGMTLNNFEAKALQVLLSQRFLSLPLFEEEELSEYHIADDQGEMNLEDFIRQYAEVITEQFKADYETRLKAEKVTMLDEIRADIEMKKLEDSPNFCIKAHNNAVDKVLQIIDKYKAETEEV